MDMPTVALLRLAYNRLANEIGAAVRGVAPDIRPSHGAILEQLDFDDGLRLTDLALGAQLTPQSTGELIDQLEQLGYVERRPDPTDRRAKRIYRTEKAKQASKTAAKAASRSDAELDQLLGAKNHQQLREALAAITDESG